MSITKREGGGYQSALLEASGVVEHLFGTAGVEPEGKYLLLRQVHSARIVAAGDWREGLEGDGLHTGEEGVRVGVKTADCVPLLLCDPVRRVVAAVHAGWRGVVQDIAGRTVKALEDAYGSRAEDLLAAAGPAIGGCCYEVGPEVAWRFRELFPERDDLGRRTTVDLREAVRRQLMGRGLKGERVEVAQECTYCGGREFHSWRRDKQGRRRMYSVIGVKGTR